MLANARLITFPLAAFFRAVVVSVVVNVAVLLVLHPVFTCHHHPTRAAPKYASERFGRSGCLVVVSPSFGKHCLCIIEQFLRNDRLMYPFMHLAFVKEVPIVERVPENPGNVGISEHFSRYQFRTPSGKNRKGSKSMVSSLL